jgi:preprotein translocase subunit YajC
MTELISLPRLLVIAQTAAPAQNIWVQLFPFAMMLLIFYLLVLMPMRRRQKKVQQFQASIKVGDKVITTGGMYGQVTRIDENTAQIQVADKVKIEVARAAIAGYQGQDPVVQRDGAGGM